MNVIVTAGGTEEKIDHVRKITNMGTGRLGSRIGEAFAEYAEVKRIFYICGPGAATPQLSGMPERLTLIRITDVTELDRELTRLLTQESIDAVVHSMAVSDYTVEGMITKKKMAESVALELSTMRGIQTLLGKASRGEAEPLSQLEDRILNVITEHCSALDHKGKVSSGLEGLMITMKRTPKVIRRVKELCPAAILVGFKLLDGVSSQELFEVSAALMEKNRCDFVLANDLQNVGEQEHQAFLMNSSGAYEQLNGKEEIAHRIALRVMGKYGENRRRAAQ